MSVLTRYDLGAMTAAERASLTRRSVVPDPDIAAAATEICQRVAARGDAAVTEYADRFGGGWRRIDDAEMATALDSLDPDLRAALDAAVDAVTAYHRAQLPSPMAVSTAPGVEVTRQWQPLARVGAYVPGGKAVYPSTVVMTVVPAVVAGVEEIVVVSPAADDGSLSPVLLAACRLAGATELWAGGGAQAIAALAHGTASIRPVDKIVGPGNSYVTAAKLAVFGVCGIDLPAGPSEVLVLADSSADPRLIAVDLLCQAEHGPDSPAILVTTDPDLADAVDAEIARLVPRLDRSEILAKALADHGIVVLADSEDAAVAFANEYAAEHVSIMTTDPERDAGRIVSAGSVYVGEWAPESAGDYATGANHVLPTGGLARACGPLSTEDFGSWRQVQRISRSGLESIAPTITRLAEAEGLTAHSLAARIRLDPDLEGT